MREPLYHVGQDVAAMDAGLKHVFPATKIVGIYGWINRGDILTGKVVCTKTGYWYEIPNRFAAHESAIRPINPDTEYLDTTQDIAAPVDGVSV